MIEGQNTFALALCFAQVLCDRWSKMHVIRFRVIEGPNAHDQNVFCASHTFLVEVQMNAGVQRKSLPIAQG